MGNVAWKIMGTGGAVLAALLATKIVDAIWARAGQDDINPQNPDAPLSKAIAYAALTGVAVGVARTFYQRKAAQYYRESAGHLPEELVEEPV